MIRVDYLPKEEVEDRNLVLPEPVDDGRRKD